jgi:hypothetical protein
MKFWRGIETPPIRESAGVAPSSGKRKRYDKSYRKRYQNVTYRYRDEFIRLIQETEPCDEGPAERIFNSMRNSRALKPPIKRHKPTNTWGGSEAPEPTLDDFDGQPRTTKQQDYWKLFREMPWLDHDRRKPEESKAIPWLMDSAGVDRGEAERLIGRAFNCSKDQSKIPLCFRVVEGVKQIGGKEYVEAFRLTGEIREKLLNMEPVIDEEEYDRELDNRIMAATGCKRSQSRDVEELALEEELLVKVDMVVNGEDRGVICGKKFHDDLVVKQRAKEVEAQEKKAQEEARKQEAEQKRKELASAKRQEEKELAEKMVAQQKRIETLANELRKMPRINQDKAPQWVKNNLGDKLDGLEPEVVLSQAFHKYKTIIYLPDGLLSVPPSVRLDTIGSEGFGRFPALLLGSCYCSAQPRS